MFDKLNVQVIKYTIPKGLLPTNLLTYFFLICLLFVSSNNTNKLNWLFLKYVNRYIVKCFLLLFLCSWNCLMKIFYSKPDSRLILHITKYNLKPRCMLCLCYGTGLQLPVTARTSATVLILTITTEQCVKCYKYTLMGHVLTVIEFFFLTMIENTI